MIEIQTPPRAPRALSTAIVSSMAHIERLDLSAARSSRFVRLWTRTDVRLALIALLCLFPRAIVAWRLPAVCDDAYFYGHVADSLDRGHFARALEYLNINIYPIVLMALHRLGLDWIVAGKLWSVLLGTLVVLPLYDWLRRLFDERIALVGVFLYAVHPKIIESTAEPIREATFWFLFVLCLDLFLIAGRELRWWQFLAGGASLALALHTRFEAWFLLVPLCVGTAVSAWRRPRDRSRPILGSLLCLAMTPVFVFVVNVTLLAHHPHWELGRLAPFQILVDRLPLPAKDAASAVLPVKSQGSVAQAAPAPPPAARGYVGEMTHALGFVFLALIAVGLVQARRILLRPQIVSLTILTAALPLAVWIHWTEYGNLNGRYFLLLMLIDAPFAAMGALTAMQWIKRSARGWQSPLAGLATHPGCLAGCLVIAGFGQELSSHHNHRETQVQLGAWIAKQRGRFHSVVADFESIRPAYAAAHTMPDVVLYDEFFEKRFDQSPPDLAIFLPSWYRPELIPILVDRAKRLGLEPLDQTSFSTGKPEFVVFARRIAHPPGAPPASAGRPGTTVSR